MMVIIMLMVIDDNNKGYDDGDDALNVKNIYYFEKQEIVYTAVVFLLIKVNYIQKYTLLERYSNHNLLICADIYIIINNNHYIHKQIS